MIGLDTSAIIDLFRGEEKVGKFLESNQEPLAVTIMSYLELSFGLDPSNPKHREEGKYYDEFFKGLFDIGLTKDSCEEASKIFWNLKKEGKSIEQFDCVIAAMFLSQGVTQILTKNSRHFDNIKELKVLSY